MQLCYYTTLSPSQGSAWCGLHFYFWPPINLSWLNGEVPFISGFSKPIPSLRILSVSHMLMLLAGSFSQKFRVYFVHTFFEATSPLHGAGGVVFEVYFWWVSNGAPRRPLDASKGRPSLTSYNGIVSVPLWPRSNFAKKWLRQIDWRLLHLLNLTFIWSIYISECRVNYHM
jgi:hypothetical protein